MKKKIKEKARKKNLGEFFARLVKSPDQVILRYLETPIDGFHGSKLD